eukprot:CAMPEP_0181475940 /NCGR_PEP_ID=MMETSP1110-20121109/41449_1 /TAXON_ID=174948 /ORGANISM="Symbiodinium sp., Strain CCMP421" /LENGTH=132 /DNA_ID=CAMNT_0023601205 /DNA_START=153 /DNA_END=548 /DNA_ORIENTATION=-
MGCKGSKAVQTQQQQAGTLLEAPGVVETKADQAPAARTAGDEAERPAQAEGDILTEVKDAVAEEVKEQVKDELKEELKEQVPDPPVVDAPASMDIFPVMEPGRMPAEGCWQLPAAPEQSLTHPETLESLGLA